MTILSKNAEGGDRIGACGGPAGRWGLRHILAQALIAPESVVFNASIFGATVFFQ